MDKLLRFNLQMKKKMKSLHRLETQNHRNPDSQNANMKHSISQMSPKIK